MTRTSLIFTVLMTTLSMAGCSKEKKPEAQLFAPGEKATVNGLNFNLIDTQVVQQLGDDPATARTPKNRFILVQVSVSNAGNDEVAIPGLSLVDDAGTIYNELPDGTGVEHWLGMVRKISGTQTDTGVIVFDAPAKHYKLRLTDEFADAEVAIDMPLTFMHEQMQHVVTQSQEIPAPPAPADPIAAAAGAAAAPAPAVPGKKK